MLSLETFGQVMAVVELTIGKPVPEGQTKAYYDLFKDVEDLKFRRAMELALREQQYPALPMPGAISKHLPQAAPVSLTDRAKEAWGRVLRAIKEHGGYASIDFDPVTNATVRSLGGWAFLCDKSSDDLTKWVAKDFGTTYESFARRGIVDSEYAAPLLGICDNDNSLKGFGLGNVVVMRSLLTELPVTVQPSRIEYRPPVSPQPSTRPRALPSNPAASLAASFGVPKSSIAEPAQPRPMRPNMADRKGTEQIPTDRPKLTLSPADAARLAALREKQNTAASSPSMPLDQPQPAQA